MIPQREIPRLVTQPGWCEQDPDDWWAAFLGALASLDSVSLSAVSHIGIAYQMHGLVLVDAQ
ncbi:FGGY family carbohydrate kinase, partial [Escherichia coli]|uniref:FGGY family carbohydrate kinase n=1 Tax=Escherichia coli TaxID=562 RepID=UPI0039E138ED